MATSFSPYSQTSTEQCYCGLWVADGYDLTILALLNTSNMTPEIAMPYVDKGDLEL